MIVNSKFGIYSNPVLLITTDEKLAIKAANSLPEFFQEEFPTFQKFIDLYYQQQTQRKDGYLKIESIKDIDEICEKYLQAFYKTFAHNMPVFPYMGMADFIRNAKRFYVSRGSEESFRFLFRVMFGLEIDFKYPQENMFKTSQGKWNQKVSVYVDISSGTINDTLVGKKLLVKAFDGSTTALVVKGFTQVQGTVWELEVENFVSQKIVSGAKVFALQNPQTLDYAIKGEITTTLNSYKILTPGADFRLGTVYDFVSTVGTISFIITALDDNKGIKRIEFLSFAGETWSPETYTSNGFSIQFSPNTVNRYSGFYETTDGFLSDNSKLQDSYFYQIFSYVIKSRVSRELYEDIALRILHPSGLIMFSEYEKSANHQLNIQTNSDAQSALDILDILNVYDSFSRTFVAYRTFSDSISISDSVLLDFNKVLEDTVSVTESGLVQYWEAGTYTTTNYCVDELYTQNSYQSRTI